MATIKELKIKFTVDMNDYKAKMNQAAEAARNVQTKIDGLGESLKTTGGLSTSEVTKLGRTLSTAGQQAARLGKQAQSLATDEGHLSRAIQEQLGKAADLGQEYKVLSTQVDELTNIANKVRNATKGIDLATPLHEQRQAAWEAIQQYTNDLETLQRAISLSGDGPLVWLGGNNMIQADTAKQKLVELETELGKAEQLYNRLTAAEGKIGAENLGYASTKGLTQLEKEIDQSTAKLDRLRSQTTSAEYAATTYGQRLEQVRNAQADNATATQELSDKVDNLGASLNRSTSLLDRVAEAGRSAASSLGRMATSAIHTGLTGIGNRIRGIGNSAKSAADGGLNNMVKQIRNIGVVSLGLKLCTSLFGRLRSVVSNYVSENETLSASVTRLKNGLGQALAPAINLVVNAMSKLLPYIIGVADAVASLITNIFGTGWTSVSTGASTAADAVDDVADATDDATAAQEAYNRTVAGFDEITKLNDNSSSSSGTGGTGSTGATTSTTDGTEGIAGILPEWLANIASLIENSEWAELGTYLADCLGSAVDKIYDVLTSETTYAKIDSAVNALTTTVNSFFKEMNLIDDETGDSIAEKLGKTIGAAINLAAYTVNSVVTGIDWSEIGLTIANVINGAVEETDFSLVGETIANWFLVLPKTLYSAIVNTDWGAVTSGLSEMIISAVTNVTDWLYDLDMTAVADSISDAFAGIDWLGIAGSIVELLATAIGKSVELLAALGENIAEGLVNGIGGFFADIKEWIDENILQPFISGIKSIFGIASPAKNEELVSVGENIGLGLLNAIASAFTSIGTWVQENILAPITDALSSAGDFAVSIGVTLSSTASEVWNTFKTAWGKLSGVAVSIANSLKSSASSLWSTFSSNWGSRAVSIANSLKSRASSLWNTLKSNWGSRAVSIANSLKTSASSLWSTFKSKWGTRSVSITNTLKNTASSLWSSFKKGWSGKTLSLTITYSTNVGAVKKAVYKALGVSGWPTIIFAARGGIVDRATLFGDTVAGEAGQEAIVPLERNTQWADIVATQIANKLSQSGGGNQTVTINTYVTLDGKVVGKASADYAISQARATG